MTLRIRVLSLLFAIAVAAAAPAVVEDHAAGAAENPWPETVVNGFSTPSGEGFWLVHADGTVETHGDAEHFGDASDLALKGPVVGGAVTPEGNGYWLVAQDGGIFTFGDAEFHGSTGDLVLKQPVFSMMSTNTGEGYWLVAADGGIFTFGDAEFHGSTGDLTLNQPIIGAIASATGNGYRLVAADGGVFSFGDAEYYGSLPEKGLEIDDVFGIAPTPTNDGYWVARSVAFVLTFGDAETLDAGDDPYLECERFRVAIFSNPTAQGYRFVTGSGNTYAFGDAPGGDSPTGTTNPCGPPDCDPSYLWRCLPPTPPDLDCPDIGEFGIATVAPDPHQLDRDGDGTGCNVFGPWWEDGHDYATGACVKPEWGCGP